MKIQCWHIYDHYGYEAIATLLNTGKERHKVLDLCDKYLTEEGSTLYGISTWTEEISWYPLDTDIWNLLWEIEL
jgi:hypothetical protein